MRVHRLVLILAGSVLALTTTACNKKQSNTKDNQSGSAAASKATGAPAKAKAQPKDKALAKAPTAPPTTTLDVPKPGATPGAVQNSRAGAGVDALHSGIYRRVRRNLRRVNACYAMQRRRNPQLAGKLTVEMTVAASGSVSQAHVVSRSFSNARLEGCVVATVKSFSFDPLKPRQPVTLVLPLLFR